MLSLRTVVELADHEGLVLEAYKDVRGIWTWGVGVTSASGHRVERYIDNPSTIQRAIEVYEWLLRTKYLPDVLEAFRGHRLSESQLAAALSFHYNTGAIKRARWVRLWKAGDIEGARRSFMSWSRPQAIIPRRRAEQRLFFDGVWSSDGQVLIFDVAKPSYRPVRPRAVGITRYLSI